jgi:tetratricopeptide (TPR) repeat protein
MRTIIQLALYRVLTIIGVAVLCTIATPNVTLSADGTLWKTWRDAGIQAWQEGRLATAEHLLIAAMEQAEKFGPEDMKVADTANDLAVVYATAGKITEAELLFRRSLAIGIRGFGTEHPAVGATMQNLGILYAMEHQYLAAEQLLKHALEVDLKQFGFTHIRTAQTLKTLASLYAVQGQMAQAERLIRASLTILEVTQVKHEDPQMIGTLEVFASILRNTNRDREAQEIEQHLEADATVSQNSD